MTEIMLLGRPKDDSAPEPGTTYTAPGVATRTPELRRRYSAVKPQRRREQMFGTCSRLTIKGNREDGCNKAYRK